MGYTWAVGYTKHFLGSCRVPYWPQNAIATLQYPHETAQFADQAVLDESPLVPLQKTVLVQEYNNYVVSHVNFIYQPFPNMNK